MDIEKLKALALAATPGKWERGDSKTNGTHDLIVYGEELSGAAICEMRSQFNLTPPERRVQNLEYIAAACPATVLELIAEVERLRADAARYRWMRDFSSEVCHPFIAAYTEAAKYDDGLHPDPLLGEDADHAVDAAIEAHTRSSKEQACGS